MTGRRTICVTVGYRSDVVLDQLFAVGIAGSPVILLVGLAFDDEARRELVRVMDEVSSRLPAGVKVYRSIYTGGFPEVLESLARDVSSRWGAEGELVFLLSGGSRLLVLAAMLAAVTLSAEHGDLVRVYVGRDFNPIHLFEVHVHAANTLSRLSQTHLKVLSALASSGEASTTRLARQLGLTPSTTSRALKVLEREGLAEKVKGKSKYRPTDRGRTLLVRARLARLWP